MLDYPSVALEFMNRDHAEFVDMLAGLLARLAAPAPDHELDGLLDALLEHTRHHFAEEERLMQETRFPPFPVHKGEHDAVLGDMSARIGLWKQKRDRDSLRAWLQGPVSDWFINHVQTMDFVTAGYISTQQKDQP